MGEQYQAHAQPQRACRPGEGAAERVIGIEDDEGAAPYAEAEREQHKLAGRNRTRGHLTFLAFRAAGLRVGRALRGHGRAPSMAASAGSANTRSTAMAPVTTV